MSITSEVKVINMFTGKEVNESFLKHFKNVGPINKQIDISDNIFFAEAAKAAKAAAIKHPYFNPFLEDPANTYTPVNVFVYKCNDISEGDLSELQFLDNLCLVLIDPQHDVYILAEAYTIFYKEPGGIFRNDTSAKKWHQIRPKAYQPFRDLLLNYTLPGRYWRAHTVRKRLANNIELALSLDSEMISIETEWHALNAISVHVLDE